MVWRNATLPRRTRLAPPITCLTQRRDVVNVDAGFEHIIQPAGANASHSPENSSPQASSPAR